MSILNFFNIFNCIIVYIYIYTSYVKYIQNNIYPLNSKYKTQLQINIINIHRHQTHQRYTEKWSSVSMGRRTESWGCRKARKCKCCIRRTRVGTLPSIPVGIRDSFPSTISTWFVLYKNIKISCWFKWE